MNIILPLLSLIVIYQAAHFGAKKAGEMLIPENVKKFLVFNADLVEIFGLLCGFVKWIVKIYCLNNLIQLTDIDFAGDGGLQIAELSQPAYWLIASVAMDFFKGIFSNISEKKRNVSKTAMPSITMGN